MPLRLFLLLWAWAWAARGAPLQFAFDWDDNVLRMPTKVMLIHRETGAELPITPAEFAVVRTEVGKPGTRYADYFLSQDLVRGSHRYFADERGDGVNRFLSDVRRAVESGSGWRGPSWKAFQRALSDPETAAATGIVTARMHHAESILEALRWLQARGEIRYLPPVRNIWTVRNPRFPSRFREQTGSLREDVLADDAVLRKLAVLETAAEEVDRLGGRRRWSFSDDDWNNFRALRDRLQERLDRGDLRNLDIRLFFTGEHHPTEEPHGVSLRPAGADRRKRELQLEALVRACAR